MKKTIFFIGIISFLTVVSILIICFTPLANFLAKPLLVSSKPQKADVILVLSGGIYQNGSLSYFSMERIVQAVTLYKKNYAHKLILSGGISLKNNKVTDAKALEKVALDLGVKKEDIILEDKSKNTIENIKNSQKIITDKKFSTVLLVTSPIHVYRSMLIAKKTGLNLISASLPSFEEYRQVPIDRLLLFYFTVREYGALFILHIKGV